VGTCVAKIQRAPARLPFKKHIFNNWQLLLLAQRIGTIEITAYTSAPFFSNSSSCSCHLSQLFFAYYVIKFYRHMETWQLQHNLIEIFILETQFITTET